MTAQPQYLPVLGCIELVQPATAPSFEGRSRGIKRNLTVDEAVKDETLLAIADYCERKYLSAPYVMGAQLNDELAEAVQMKYLRSLPDWEPTEELPALKPTITSHGLIKHWIARCAKTTNIDLCRAHATYREHYPLASSLIPVGAEDFDALEWAQGDAECEVGSSRLASFYTLTKDDWQKNHLLQEPNHPLPESCKAWTRVVPMPGVDKYKLMARRNAKRLSEEQLATKCGLSVEVIRKAEEGRRIPVGQMRTIVRALGTTVDALAKGEMVLEPLNNPLKASSESKPYSVGQQYKVWPAEAHAIVGQALSKLSPNSARSFAGMGRCRV